jgi:ATP-dependent Clp protease ATP-binding subunit ClpA
VDFQNTVIIMTSNAGSRQLTSRSKAHLGFQLAAATGEGERAALHERVLDAVKETFRPEFLNRIDEVIVFDRLSQPQLREVVQKMLRDVRERLADRGVELTLSEAAADWLVERGYDDAFGARPLRRLIQREVENALARRLLAREVREGDRVVVEVGPEGLTFEVQSEQLVPTPVATAA